MQKELKNYAFIDGQNLYLGIQELGWKLDYKRFRVYLKEKYGVEKAYMFMGFLPDNRDLYSFLQGMGYILVFKPIIPGEDGRVKGNCDAELVLQAMIDFPKYDQAVVVTGDGDFYCLVKHLDRQGKLRKILAPSTENCSSLLTKTAGTMVGKKVAFVSDLQRKLAYSKRKTPHKDETS
jgi:uncharacterized LabA/DUF88 family protein